MNPSTHASPLSTPRLRLSDIHKRRLDVFVEIPPSPLRNLTLTPKASANATTKSTPMDSKRQNLPRATPESLKRKYQVFVEIPHSPLHNITPRSASKTNKPNASHRRRSQVHVEIQPSPLVKSHMKGTLGNTARASPLSTKAFNVNTTAGFPNKKPKLFDVPSAMQQDHEIAPADAYPTGFFYCHQCRRKFDNSFGLHCTVLSNIRCKSTYCKSCLRNRYGQDIEAIKQQAAARGSNQGSRSAYYWTCPKCLDNCNCTKCRKAKGLPPTGKLVVHPQNVETYALPQSRMDIFKASGSPLAVDPPKKLTQLALNASKERKPRAKKPVREPRWIPVPTELTRLQVEDRYFLREFLLRFSPLMPKLAVCHLKELDLFHTLSRECAKALVLNLLDLIAADAEEDAQRLIRETTKRISGAGTNPAAVWACLHILRDRSPKDLFAAPLPDPAPLPSYVICDDSEHEPEPAVQRKSCRVNARRTAKNGPAAGEEVTLDLNNGVTHAIQLLPCILALCECVLQGASIRADIEEGADDARDENRSYFAAVRKENERWAEERASLGWREETEKEPVEDNANEQIGAKKGKAKTKDVEKDKVYRAAFAAHKAKLVALEGAHTLELQNTVPRFGPLGRDSQGRVYYAASVQREKSKHSKPKLPDEEDRTEFRKWGWFLAVWGRGGLSGTGAEQKEERWWGFSDPAEVQQLAKWLAAVEGVDGKDSIVEGADRASAIRGAGADASLAGSGGPPDAQGPPSRADVKALVKSLADYGQLLEWLLSG